MTWNPLQPRQVSSNVRQYLSEATLPNIKLASSTPSMPPDKHKSHRNTLSVTPERYRKLEQMYRLNPEVFNEDVLAFIKASIPSGPLCIDDVDPETGESIAVPCSGYSIPPTNLPPLRHIEELGASWLEHYALRTVQRILTMLPAFACSKDWSFNRPENVPDQDHSIFRYFMWNKSEVCDILNGPSDPCSLVIAYQPPWILSPHDLKQFAKTFSLPMYHEREGSCPARFNSAQRVWAKLWDVCKQKQCPWFILTNYSNWVFGCFSKGWTRAFVSDLKNGDSKNPTVLQCVLFWLVSSMKLDVGNLFEIPEVGNEPECVQRELSCIVYDVLAKDIRAGVPEMVEPDLPLSSALQSFDEFDGEASYTASESFWSGQSQEPESSAGVDFEDIGRLSPLQKPIWSLGMGSEASSTEFISRWLSQGEQLERLPPPVIPERPSPAPSEWSVPSVATIRGKSGGGYLNIIPPAYEDNRFF